jgi:diguanylate cyclase (GGDEF)-like protein
MARRLWCWYLVVGLGVMASYVFLSGRLAQNIAYVGISLSCGVAILVGTRLYRPAGRPVWYWMAAGHLLTAVGDGTYSVFRYLLGIEPFPSPADALYIGGYGGLLVGLVLLVRRRTPGRDRAGVLDAAIIASSFGLLAWVFVMQPAVGDSSLSLLGRMVSLAYPMVDVLLLALLVRLLFSRGPGGVAYRLLAVGLGLQLVADIVYALLNLLGTYSGGLVDLGWMGFYVLSGVAALHPSMGAVTARDTSGEGRLGRGRLVVLAAATLLAPAVLVAQALRHDYGAVVVIGGVSALLFVLVVSRMAGLVAQVQAQAARLATLARVDGLTGVPNRRAWDEELIRMLAHARRAGETLHVALLDLDHFKRFNDTHGHQAGDRLLKEAAAAWRAQLRTADLIARYGGEEFAVLLQGGTAAEAAEVLERLLVATPLGQTVSAGLATWDAEERAEQLVGRADAVLYEAKRTGRNRVVVAGAGDLTGTAPAGVARLSRPRLP